jgi:hypothetical protein
VHDKFKSCKMERTSLKKQSKSKYYEK